MGLQNESASALMKKASVALVAVALLLYVIAFSAPYWAETNHNVERRDHIGLWKKCSHVQTGGGGHKEVCSDYIDLLTEDWLKTSQAFMTLGLFSAAATLGCIAAFVLVPSFQENLKVLAGCVASVFVTCMLTGIALAAFSSRYAGYYSKVDEAYGDPDVVSLAWCWYMVVTAGIMLVFALVMLLPDTFYAIREDIRPPNFTGKPRQPPPPPKV